MAYELREREPMQGMTRRMALRSLGLGVGGFALWPALSDEASRAFAAIQASQGAPAPVFLTAAQYATVDAFTEAIIPADDHSPGARAARVADYLDLLLSESDAEMQAAWRDGLSALDGETADRYGRAFTELDEAEVRALLTDISRHERDPQTSLEEFFAATKQAAIRGYYTSEVGIHQELGYKGNQHIAEFVGCRTVDGEPCPHCGQQPETGTQG